MPFNICIEGEAWGGKLACAELPRIWVTIRMEKKKMGEDY